MSLSGEVRALLLTAMLGVALFHLLRLAGRRFTDAAVEMAHLAMALTMIAMLAGDVTPVRAQWLAGAFAVATAAFAWRGVRRYVLGGSRTAVVDLTVVVGAAAMVVMLLAIPSATRMSSVGSTAMSSVGSSAEPAALSAAMLSPTVLLIAIAAVAVVGVRAVCAAGRPTGRFGVAAGCQFAMSATTVCMLLAM